jgi:hypothetical protein
MPRLLPILLLAVLFTACRSHTPETPKKTWTYRDIMAFQGKTMDEVKAELGTPNGFYTRSAEGRWHYSDVLMDTEGAGPPKRVWIVIYFSQFGDRKATIVEIHDHTDE